MENLRQERVAQTGDDYHRQPLNHRSQFPGHAIDAPAEDAKAKQDQHGGVEPVNGQCVTRHCMDWGCYGNHESNIVNGYGLLNFSAKSIQKSNLDASNQSRTGNGRDGAALSAPRLAAQRPCLDVLSRRFRALRAVTAQRAVPAKRTVTLALSF